MAEFPDKSIADTKLEFRQWAEQQAAAYHQALDRERQTFFEELEEARALEVEAYRAALRRGPAAHRCPSKRGEARPRSAPTARPTVGTSVIYGGGLFSVDHWLRSRFGRE